MKFEYQIANDYCKQVTDGTHDSPKSKENGHYLITSKHLGRYSLDFASANRISEENYLKIIKRSNVEQWDILFSMIGTIGNIYLERNSDVNYACKNVGIFKLGGDKNKAIWLYYYLQSPKAKEYIFSSLRGTTQNYVPLDALRKMPIGVCDESEMNKITSVLSVLDEKIALYPFTFMAVIDLLSMLPSFTVINSGFKVLKVFRLFRTLRVLRVFKAIRYSKNIRIIINVVKKQKNSLGIVGILAVGYILICALIIFNVEPETFDTFFDAIYWATVSLTTVGYGDIYAVSVVGKIITMVSALFGIAIVALPAGIITAGYMEELGETKTENTDS